MKRMKKVMLAMGFLVLVAFSFASENKSEININPVELSKGLIQKNEAVVLPIDLQDFSCTVTYKATVGPSYASIEATCSATSESCEDATNKALACITYAAKRGLAIFK